MHVRISRAKRNGKVYEYVQLVQSFRREDGVPAHRVIATLGSPSEVPVENLKTAFAAAREGKTVTLATLPHGKTPKPQASLRYLELAVLLEVWRGWGLDELLQRLLGDRLSEAMVCALVLHRCIDPQSKLHAVRWFGRTALPHLLDVSPAKFNNTRLHRVLDLLDRHTYELMAASSARVAQRHDELVAMYADVSDAWFVGDGPDLAVRGKTKEGLVKRKIGIVLLCTSTPGLPLRWDVVAGNQADDKALQTMLDSIEGLGWTKGVPVVADRAMGNTSDIRKMAATGLLFLTALRSTEMGKYAPELPTRVLESLAVASNDDTDVLAKRAAELVCGAGMTRVDETLYTMDCGIVDLSEAPPDVALDEDRVASALKLARQMQELVREGTHPTLVAAARALGLTQAQGKKYHRLLALADSVQAEVLHGRAAGCSLTQILGITKLPTADQQLASFEKIAASVRSLVGSASSKTTAERRSLAAPLEVRCVAYFNPDVFVAKRRRARQRLDEIKELVAELNAKAARPHSKHTTDTMRRALEQKLVRHDLVSAFEVAVSKDPSTDRPQISAQLDQGNWRKRRSHDGFTVLVAHPKLAQGAAELSRMYRSKHQVEVDFHIIKSVLKIRPVHHRTDAKVRAHVTLCMLALLLQRTLHDRLQSCSAEAALEMLSSCYLHRWSAPTRAADAPAAYSVTELDSEQAAILRELDMTHLADDAALLARLEPRA